MASASSLSTQLFASNRSITSYNSQKICFKTRLPLLDLGKALTKHVPPGPLLASSWASSLQKRPCVCAVYGNGGVGGEEGRVAAAVAEAENASKRKELKQALEDSIHSTERGFQANAETRSEIMELITQLEAHNPHPNPLEFLDLLDGKWILRYTSLSDFFPLQAVKNLPLIRVGEISQTISANESLMVNSVTFIGPLGTTSLSVNASFEICSPKRVQIKFQEGIVGAPQLNNALDLPESFTFLGQKVDLTAFQGIFQTLQSATVSIARTISGQPPLKFRIRNENVQPWLLITYLDQDLRISRGDNGSVFVFVKDASELME